jgi:hypothetical protein
MERKMLQGVKDEGRKQGTQATGLQHMPRSLQPWETGRPWHDLEEETNSWVREAAHSNSDACELFQAS